MITIATFILAAVLEIAGCFALWAWMRHGASALWLIPGVAALVGFGWVLTKVDTEMAGRAYATYGGIYIVASLIWMWTVEGQRPDRWDLIGGVICLVGAAVILNAPRSV